MARLDKVSLFNSVYHELQAVLLGQAESKYGLDAHRKEYLRAMMDTTCLGGKCNRGLAVVELVDTLTPDLTDDSAKHDTLFKAAVGGWSIELMQAHFLVEDDIMDDSITRRGKPCWYRHPGVTTQSAINDGLIILAWASQTIIHYFKSQPTTLLPLLELFHTTDYRTTLGQLYDVTSMRNSDDVADPNTVAHVTTDFKEFTPEFYRRIVRHKTAYYTYHCPLAMGLILSGGAAAEKVSQQSVEQVAMLMGEYFQAQDDFLDCYADPKTLGKVGTDIEDMKCSWLAVTFIQHASPEQFELFKQHYGKHDPADVAVIKKLYDEVDLKEKFAAYELDLSKNVEALLSEFKSSHPLFEAGVRSLWDKTYKRSK